MAKDEASEVNEATQAEASPVEFAALVAARSHFTAVRDRAIANLNNYIFNPVGVGEHPDIAGECIKLVEEIDRAESVLQTISRISQ